MAWNRTTREQYKREAVRYESDLTAAEWELIEPLIPRQGRLGRPRERDLREVFNAVQYQLATGCQWRALPNCFPPQGRTLRVSTVQNYFYSWRDTGVFDRMMDPKSPSFVILELLARAPTVAKLFADGGYAGPKLAGRSKKLGLSDLLEIVVKPKGETRRVRL